MEPKIEIGINGDEFPITWDIDGNQYTGAGDNSQRYLPPPNSSSSPLSFFKLSVGRSRWGVLTRRREGTNPHPSARMLPSKGRSVSVSAYITFCGRPVPLLVYERVCVLRFQPVPVNGPDAKAACPSWNRGIPNLKSSGVLSLDGTLYWAVSCFNYGDDAVFNRQRYGPAWIITSTDKGQSWWGIISHGPSTLVVLAAFLAFLTCS
eukprot:COSAG05_NODE_1602_length_4434_cov_2.280277_3_plen_206_part_00